MATGSVGWAPRWSEIHSRSYGGGVKCKSGVRDQARAGIVPRQLLPSDPEHRMSSFPGRGAAGTSAVYHELGRGALMQYSG